MLLRRQCYAVTKKTVTTETRYNGYSLGKLLPATFFVQNALPFSTRSGLLSSSRMGWRAHRSPPWFSRLPGSANSPLFNPGASPTPCNTNKKEKPYLSARPRERGDYTLVYRRVFSTLSTCQVYKDTGANVSVLSVRWTAVPQIVNRLRATGMGQPGIGILARNGTRVTGGNT